MDLKSLTKNAISYANFIDLVQQLYADNKVTGAEQTAVRLEATKINLQRIKRLNKVTTLNDKLRSVFEKVKSKQIWIVFVEGWCGDVAQNVPILEKIALESNGFVEIKYLLRDDNLELFDHFLTNGARAIPKLIAFSDEKSEILFQWGPRPKTIQAWYKELLSTIDESGKEDAKLKLHQYYSSNKGEALQDDIIQLLSELK
jgi:thioredoxin-like negative regulator of GroEL